MYRERYDRDGQQYPHYRPAGPYRGRPGGTRAYRDLEPRRGQRGATTTTSPSRHRASLQRKPMPLWQELPLLLIVAFCLAVLIRTFLLQAFFIPSGSMQDTLAIGDRVLVNKVVYDTRDPVRGEIVVFRGTDAWAPESALANEEVSFSTRLGRTIGDLVGVSRPGEKDFIKRVIGLPGDKVSCCDVQGRVIVNGQPLDEAYVLENSPLEPLVAGRECRTRRFTEVQVGPGQLFVMGDHRLVSQDSRCQGQVPIENVIGRAFVIAWPNSRWGSLTVPDNFADVPPALALAPNGPAPGRAGVTTQGGIATAMPILLSLGFFTRFRRGSRAPHRRLRA